MSTSPTPQVRIRPELEGDFIKEVKRLIEIRKVRADVIDKRPADEVQKDPCTHSTSCPCMAIG